MARITSSKTSSKLYRIVVCQLSRVTLIYAEFLLLSLRTKGKKRPIPTSASIFAVVKSTGYKTGGMVAVLALFAATTLAVAQTNQFNKAPAQEIHDVRVIKKN